MTHILLLILLSIVVLFSISVLVSSSVEGEIVVKVVNEATNPIHVYWIDTFSSAEHTLMLQTDKPIRNRTDIELNTYVGHQFSVRWAAKHKAGTDVNFTVIGSDKSIVVRHDKKKGRLVIERENELSKMKKTVQEAVDACDSFKKDQAHFKNCITEILVDEIKTTTESKERMEKYRALMSDRVRNYTCADETLETTQSLKNYTYYYLDNSYTVNVMLETANAKIWMIENFATEKECEILMNEARPRLFKAVVNGGDGRDAYSETRKAQQASIEFPEDYRSETLWPLYYRIIKVINYHGKQSIHPDYQEGFSIIQYNPGDEYTSHCDGTCDGSTFIPTARVATSIVYCKVPEEGGATVFPNADIYIKPKNLAAIMFTYKGPDGKFDTKNTLHSGCPVRKGEKWIVTSWLREGVNANKPWYDYDPHGIPVLQDDSEALRVMEDIDISLSGSN